MSKKRKSSENDSYSGYLNSDRSEKLKKTYLSRSSNEYNVFDKIFLKKRNIKNEEKIKKKLIEKLLNDEEFVN